MAWPRMVYHKPEVKPTLIVLGILGFLVLSCMGLTCLGLYDMSRVEIGYQEKSVDWLPEEASNVSYFRAYLVNAYEFEISEQGFREWEPYADELQEITRPVPVQRFVFGFKWSQALLADYGVPPDEPEEHTATRGLYYHHEASNGGISTVIYDRDKGKAYRFTTPR